MKKFLINQVPLIILLCLSGFVIWPAFVAGYFSHHDYLQVMRIYEMRQCFADLQIPCRWVPDMGFGYGLPMFNYYGVLPYYIGGLLSYILGFVGAAKALFVIPLVAGSIGMFLLARSFTNQYVGLVVGVLYLFVPYRALDAYVRGAISESFAIAIIPFVFYFIWVLVKEGRSKNWIGLVISLTLFLLCHNIMTLFFIPIIFVWLTYLVLIRKTQFTKLLIFGVLIGFGLSAFFVLPAYFEKDLVQIENLKESEYIPNFRAHFVTVPQLFFDHFWGYGASLWGKEDGISFQVGWPHWWLALIATLLFGLKFIRQLISKIQKKSFSLKDLFAQMQVDTSSKIVIALFLLFTASVLMTHNKSAFLWELSDTLQFAQFPWRFLSVSVFAVCLLSGLAVLLLPLKIRQIGTVIIIVLTVYLNWHFFQPGKFFPDASDGSLLSGEQWDFQRQGAIIDYLPQGAKVPKKPAPNEPEVTQGVANITDFRKSSSKFSFVVSADENAQIEIPIFYFPGWKININEDNIKTLSISELGAMSIDVPSGKHIVKGSFGNTLLRSLSNMVSLGSLFIFVSFALYYRKLSFPKQK